MPLGSGGSTFFGGSGFLKSVQTGTIDLNNVTSNTATISSVVTTLTFLQPRGKTHARNSDYNADSCWSHIALTNATTLTATRKTGEATAFPVGYTAVETLGGIRQVQRSTVDVNGGTSATATISSVTTSRAWVIDLGHIINSATNYPANVNDTLTTLTNATTITISINSNPAVSHITSFDCAEAT